MSKPTTKANITLYGDWAKLRARYNQTILAFDSAIQAALKEEGAYYAEKIVEGMDSGSPGGKPFTPLKQSTIDTREALGIKSRDPLNETGALKKTIGYEVVKTTLFVGSMRAGSERSDKFDSVKLANIHEFGYGPIVIKVTPAMRAFLAITLGDKGTKQVRPRQGTGVIIINIPARPFITPIFEKYAKGNPGLNRFTDRLLSHMRKRVRV